MSVARTKKPKYAHKWHHNTNKASQREETFQQTVIWSVQFLSFLNNCFETVKGINPSDSASLFSLARNYPAYTSWFVQALDASPLSALFYTGQALHPSPPLLGRAQPPLTLDTAPRHATSLCLRGFWKKILPRDLQPAHLLCLKCRATWSN